MKNSKLAKTLKSLLAKDKLSESELARKTGVGQPVIHRMASGETDNPKIESLRPIAKFFSISIDQLIGDVPIPTTLPKYHIEQEMYNLPLITLSDATTWPLCRNELILKTYVQTNIQISEFAYAIRLRDSTMTPMFPDGTLLIIEPNHQYKHRDFVVAQLSGEKKAIFKQLLIDGPKKYLKSVDREYPPIEMQIKDHILGVMLQARIDFRRN